MRIAGSIAVITGASSGIGEATAWALARRGARVVLGARRADRLEALASAIQRAGGQALAVPTDVTVRADIDRLMAAAVERYGRIDVLVNNAGIGVGSRVLLSRDASMQRLLEVNLLAPARAIQAAVPHMTGPQGGVIVNVGSVAGEGAGMGLYAASKYGVRGLSDALRWELQPRGIAVVLIEPGFIRTDLTEGIRLPAALFPGPELVAQAIARSIERPRRTVIVPWWYRPLVWGMRLLPWLADWLLIRGTRRLEGQRPARLDAP